MLMREYALHYAAQGFRVFPVKRGTKGQEADSFSDHGRMKQPRTRRSYPDGGAHGRMLISA